MPLVSIIVPVFNAARTINCCINSCIEQTYKNIEIIVVDDASTDETRDIVNTFLFKYSNIKYYLNSKSGVTAARNEGIKHACGEYLFFLDADDILPENSIKNLYDCLVEHKACAATGTIVHEDENGEVLSYMSYDEVTELDGVQWLQSIRKTWHGHIWAILFHKSLFTPLPHCPINLRIGEDLLQIAQLATKCDRVAITDDVVYRYVKHDNSVVNSRVFSEGEVFANENIFAEEILRLSQTVTSTVRTEYRLLALYAILNLPNSEARNMLINKFKIRFLCFLVFDYQIIHELLSISIKLYIGIVFSLFKHKNH